MNSLDRTRLDGTGQKWGGARVREEAEGHAIRSLPRPSPTCRKNCNSASVGAWNWKWQRRRSCSQAKLWRIASTATAHPRRHRHTSDAPRRTSTTASHQARSISRLQCHCAATWGVGRDVPARHLFLAPHRIITTIIASSSQILPAPSSAHDTGQLLIRERLRL
ncbi:hypothetical protein KC19_2G182500 [Ceratodon purpureus]|uniref:Uncharacterized protein n=1 Tax=Ceratodon purpureus TaxID=3225 RepID=A0A8T0IVC1_CERPU|nr:hypothetical protein KC19_2G182500 [Ceratodon purpureus]